MIEKRYSWSKINQIIDRLIKKINGPFTSILAIANGGLYIGERIATKLNIPLYTVGISYYDGKKKRKLPQINTAIVNKNTAFSMVVPFEKTASPCLIVDDLIDTGETVKTLQKICSFRKEKDAIAVLFWNKSAEPKPDFYAEEKSKEWYVFPWEE